MPSPFLQRQSPWTGDAGQLWEAGVLGGGRRSSLSEHLSWTHHLWVLVGDFALGLCPLWMLLGSLPPSDIRVNVVWKWGGPRTSAGPCRGPRRAGASGGEQEGQMEGLKWQLIKATPTKKAAHLDPHYNQAERRPRAFFLHVQS